MFTFLFTKKGENVLKFATQPYGISLSLFKVAAKLPDEGIDVERSWKKGHLHRCIATEY